MDAIISVDISRESTSPSNLDGTDGLNDSLNCRLEDFKSLHWTIPVIVGGMDVH